MRRAKKVPKVRIEVRKLPVVEHDELCLTFDACYRPAQRQMKDGKACLTSTKTLPKTLLGQKVRPATVHVI